jgi:hypothetical protein
MGGPHLRLGASAREDKFISRGLSLSQLCIVLPVSCYPAFYACSIQLNVLMKSIGRRFSTPVYIVKKRSTEAIGTYLPQ